jgi:multisubunit Na+/H+ antiporter MnhB subunit
VRRTEPILTTIAQSSLYAIKMLAIWLLLRGHNEPGGGFVAGLVVAVAIALQGLAFGFRAANGIFPLPIPMLLGGGLLLAAGTVIVPILLGYPLMTSTFTHVHIPVIGDIELATAAVFDLGVFFVVVAAAKAILLEIASEKAKDVQHPGEAERGARSGGGT